MLKIRPFKYKYINRTKSNKKYVLEIGIGNESPLMFHKYIKNCIYDGVDKNLNYNLSKDSIKLLNKFYQINLEKDSLSVIPNYFYDYIILSHVIEHIQNGESVICELIDKLKSGGIIYLEYPSFKSAKFPSMKGTLNFYDDPTHIRFYDIELLKSIFVKRDLEIVKSGIKRDYFRIIGIPYMIIKSIFILGYIRGSVFWDLLGFAEYIVARKV